MLIAALILAAATPAPAAEDADILVLASKLKQWNGRYSVKGSKVQCKTIASTGDKAIDRIGCQAFEICIGQLSTQISATDAKGLAADTRTAMKNAVKADLGRCVMDQRQQLIEQLADKRSAGG